MISDNQWAKGIDATTSDLGLANGNYLIAAGAIAAACGLLLVLGIARGQGMRQLLGLGAIVGGIGVCAVEVAAYNKMNDELAALGAGFLGNAGISVGWGIYVGAVSGAVAALGGLLALSARPGVAGSPTGSKTLMPLLGAIVLVAVVGGVIFEWPQVSKQLNGGKSSPSVPFVTFAPTDIPTAEPSLEPTEAPTAEPSSAPTPAASFYTSGYSTPELAINQFVTDNGFSYGGDCNSATASADYCSSFVSSGTSGSVYALGPPGSDAEGWVLLRQIGGKWYMADTAEAGTSPSWN